MNLCSSGHEEVCYECRSCPACEAMEKADDIQKELEAALKKIDALDTELEQAMNESEHPI